MFCSNSGQQRKFYITMSALFCFISLSSCGGSSSSTAAADDDSDTDDGVTLTTEEVGDEAVTTVLGVMNVLANLNIDADVSALSTKINQSALSVARANCSYALDSITGMDLAQSGPAATFGPTDDSVTLELDDYCNRGGDWTAYSFNSASAVSVDCGEDGDASSIYDGEGVFKVGNGTIDFYGTLKIENEYSLNCHMSYNDSGDMTATCYIDEVFFTKTESGTSCEITDVTDVEIETVEVQENLHLFPTETVGAADFGGRAVADFACRVTQASEYPDLQCLNGVRAFLSVSETDEIRDMPDNYGINTALPVLYAVDGETVADNWSGLLDGSIDTPLSVSWWSGSTTEGAVADGYDSTCSEWESNSGLVLTGSEGATDSFWIQGSEGDCGGEAYVMCLCY